MGKDNKDLTIQFKTTGMQSVKRFAFTLAEVLITLGIIGVVAAMTIPNLIAEQQKRTIVTKLQRAMSVLNQAYRRAYDDVGEASAEEAGLMGSEEYLNKYWSPYLKVAHHCSTVKDCGYASEYPFKVVNNNNATSSLLYAGKRETFYTMDGFLYIIFVLRENGRNSDGKVQYEASSNVLIDINGWEKPNRYGKDVFYFQRVIDGEKGGVVLPAGYDKTDEEINADCKKGSAGGKLCAEKIRRAGWKIEKDYPW